MWLGVPERTEQDVVFAITARTFRLTWYLVARKKASLADREIGYSDRARDYVGVIPTSARDMPVTILFVRAKYADWRATWLRSSRQGFVDCIQFSKKYRKHFCVLLLKQVDFGLQCFHSVGDGGEWIHWVVLV